MPVSFTAGFGEGNLDRQAELELQRTKSHHNAEQGKSDDPNLVEWSGPEDPGNPMNWPVWKKWIITVVLGFMALVGTFASSIFSTAVPSTSKQFGVSTEVMTLGTSLFVLGTVAYSL
jgi:MFS transporter, DHA1 family, multidrug resistance protein